MTDPQAVIPQSLRLLNQLLNTEAEMWYYHWLLWMCEQQPEIQSAILVADEKGDGQFHTKAIWPEKNAQESVLHDAAEVTLKKQKPLITPMDDGVHHIGSYPVFIDARLRAVIVVLFKANTEESMQKCLAMIEYCSAWLELRFCKHELTEQKRQQERQKAVINSVSAILDKHDYEHAAIAFVNLLGRYLGAERVALGFVKSGEVSIAFQSDSSTHSKKHELIKNTTKAMQEVVDQQETVMWPQLPGQNQIALAHAKLAEEQGKTAILTVPLVDKELCYGAVLFERQIDQPFDNDMQKTAEALTNYVGVVLEEKRQASLPLYEYVLRSARNQLSKLIGPGYLVRKLVFLAIVTVTLFFSIAKGDYNIGSDAVLEGSELRSIVVPFDGYLQSSEWRAGDSVNQGDVLAELDTRELRLQRMTWLSQQATAKRQYEDALAQQERAQVQVNAAQMQRAQAELDLIDFQISQAKMLSPFNALIVVGDLSQRVGSIVKQGEVLFEISPRETYRLAIYVNEFRIADVEKGRTGKLVLAALSDYEIPFEVTRITPLAEVQDGATVYRVEAELKETNDELRVGLEGVAQIYIDERLLIKIWTMSMVDWLKLQIWRLWG
jgi:multidrug resistance efflux pump